MAKTKQAGPLAVKAPTVDGLPKFGWYDPASLDPNPTNWRTHPEGGTPATRASIQRHGWLIPSTYNRTTGRLLNGHDRRIIAIRDGLLMPVLMVDVPAEREPEVILLLDTVTGEAGIDQERLADLLRVFRSDSRPIHELIGQLAEDQDLAGLLVRFGSDSALETWPEPYGGEDGLIHDLPAPLPPTEFPVYDDQLKTAHECPSCGYRFSGKAAVPGPVDG